MKLLITPSAAALCAAILCTIPGLRASAQTTTIEYWSNQGNAPAITVAQNSASPCLLGSITANTGRITDNDPDNFASFISLLSATCRGSIRTQIIPNPGAADVPASVGSPRYAGFLLGGDFNAVSLLSDVTLRTYDDGVLAQTAGSGLGITLLNLGSNNFFVYFQVTAPFDDVEIEFGSLATALQDLEVYYAFATAGTGTFGPVSGVPLPLQDMKLSAHAGGDGTVRLAWDEAPRGSTVTVERGADGAEQMASLATLRGGETSATDAQPLSGTTNLYRLRVQGADGSTTYSPTVSVFVKAIGDAWAVYPNPATDALHIRLAQPGEYRVTLRNAAGSEVFSRAYASEAGAVLTVARGELGLVPGLYFLELTAADGRQVHQRVALQ